MTNVEDDAAVTAGVVLHCMGTVSGTFVAFPVDADVDRRRNLQRQRESEHLLFGTCNRQPPPHPMVVRLVCVSVCVIMCFFWAWHGRRRAIVRARCTRMIK